MSSPRSERRASILVQTAVVLMVCSLAAFRLAQHSSLRSAALGVCRQGNLSFYGFSNTVPGSGQVGSCWCGTQRSACRCTPSLSIDVIVEYCLPDKTLGVIVVERRKPPLGVAFLGGYVNVGESAEDAVHREIKEEANLTLAAVEQIHVYSDPYRDARRAGAAVLFRARAHSGGLSPGDDVGRTMVMHLADAAAQTLVLGHDVMLARYQRHVRTHPPPPCTI
jgi:8-oxo-dGTP diphosphatase